jgi:hypothetical protein
MSLLIRKINIAKWKQIDINTNDDVSADAITNCLKTSKNTLSVWHIENEIDLDNAILAIVSNQDHLDTIDIVILEQDPIERNNISIVASIGETPVITLKNNHRDIIGLTYSKLGNIKDCIVAKIRDNKHKRYTIASLKKILKSAIDTGILKQEDLKESLRDKI